MSTAPVGQHLSALGLHKDTCRTADGSIESCVTANRIPLHRPSLTPVCCNKDTGELLETVCECVGMFVSCCVLGLTALPSGMAMMSRNGCRTLTVISGETADKNCLKLEPLFVVGGQLGQSQGSNKNLYLIN